MRPALAPHRAAPHQCVPDAGCRPAPARGARSRRPPPASVALASLAARANQRRAAPGPTHVLHSGSARLGRLRASRRARCGGLRHGAAARRGSRPSPEKVQCTEKQLTHNAPRMRAPTRADGAAPPQRGLGRRASLRWCRNRRETSVVLWLTRLGCAFEPPMRASTQRASRHVAAGAWPPGSAPGSRTERCEG